MKRTFKKGDRVIYIPNHANGDRNHKDCEHGIVKSYFPEHNNGKGVAFVLYDNSSHGIMTTGDEPYTAKGTCIEQLLPENIIPVNCYICNTDFFTEGEGIVECPNCKRMIMTREPY